MSKASKSRSLQQRESHLEGTEKVRSKNKYTTPHLVEYGNLAKLTRGLTMGASDGVGRTF